MHIKDTVDFRKAVKDDTATAEKWLAAIRADRAKHPQYDDRWFDHRERELFREYCSRSSWRAAKRIVELTEDPGSKARRIARLEALSGRNYDQI